MTWKDFQSTRTYDLAGHVLTQGYPQSGRSVSYSYGASGRLSSASGNLGGSSYTYADTISYNAAGQMLKERFGSATPLYHNLRYNKRLQLAEVFLGSVNDNSNWDRGKLQFYYGLIPAANQNPYLDDASNNGNLVRQWNYVPIAGGGYVTPQLDDYAYDGLNRVVSVTEAQMNSSGQWTFNVTSQTFTYDRWGNRLSVSGYNAQNWDATEASQTNRLKLPSGTSCSGAKNGLCYDAAGNLIFGNQLGASGDRTYDAEGRIVSAAGGGLNKYVYDADGRRVRRQVGAQQFWQVYGIGGELVAEYLWNGTTATLQKEYGYRDGEMLIVAEGATVRWLVTDHLDTPRMIADQTGSLSGMRRHDYYPFGEENFAGATIRTAANGYQADNVRQKFTGYERDAETNLDYAQARHYANSLGRFVSPDEALADQYEGEPQSWNLYSYVVNNPLTYFDPSGRRKERPDGTVIGSFDGEQWGDLFWNERKQLWESRQEFQSRKLNDLAQWAYYRSIYPNLFGRGIDPRGVRNVPTGQVPQMIPIVSGYRDFSNSTEGQLLMAIVPVPGGTGWMMFKALRPLAKMGHAARHLKNFQKLNPNLDADDVAKILEYVRDIAKKAGAVELTKHGGKAYEAIVDIGGKSVVVRVIESAGGLIKTGYPK